MASCAQCRLSERKKKCTPEARIWPGERCDYCVISGYPCSEFMSKKQLMNVSERERSELLEREVQRSADEIISEFDCLYYLLAEAEDLEDRLLRGHQNASFGQAALQTASQVHMIQTASNQIEKKIAEARDETRKVIDRLISKGDKRNAYLLATISSGKISYELEVIEGEYMAGDKYMTTARRHSVQACLDAGIGLHFRRFKGLEIMSRKASSSSALEYADKLNISTISLLYKTLDTVAQICNEGLEYDLNFSIFGLSESGYEMVYGNGYLFRRLSPLFFTAFFLNSEYFPGTDICVNDWPTVLSKPHVKPKNMDEYSVETKAHLAAASYLVEKSCFLSAIDVIRDHHCDYMLNFESNMVNDAPIRLSIILRLFDSFEYFINLYHKYKIFHNAKKPTVLSYPQTLPGFERANISNTVALTAFMLAIISFSPEDVLFGKFIDRFLDPEISHLWTGPIQVQLSSISNHAFAQDIYIDGIYLWPVHLAGLAKHTDLFKILFRTYDVDLAFAVSTVALVAVNNNDATLFPLLSSFFTSPNWSEPYKHLLIGFVTKHGSTELAQSLQELLPGPSMGKPEALSVLGTKEQDLFIWEHSPQWLIPKRSLLFLAQMDLDSYGTDSLLECDRQNPKGGTKTCVTAITATSMSSSTISSNKTLLSLGGMTFSVPRS
ncbi:hypothetical protein TWF788_007002 [Orbilia oligospora]|uniref:Uncharacterized protein n=1 Tax=Orbilia oligospora TaxID=2813651 RepID=A0A7C8PU47_ORBOL|nr:hypothetical protein TWF788_007002 [Orbilia oligospora]